LSARLEGTVFFFYPNFLQLLPTPMLIKLTQTPGGNHTHVNSSSNILCIFFGTTSMQHFYSNHWIRNCNKGEPIGKPTVFGIKNRVSVGSRWSSALLWWLRQERWWATVELVLDSGMMRCEKVLVLVTSLMALGVATIVGRSPPMMVRLWVSNRDNHGVWVVAICGR